MRGSLPFPNGWLMMLIIPLFIAYFPIFPYDFSIKTSQDALPAPEQSPAGEMDAQNPRNDGKMMIKSP